MKTPHSKGELFFEHTIQTWNLVIEVFTSSHLGIYDQLIKMPDTIGCDCVLLASSLGSVEHTGNAKWEWKLHRAFPIKYTGLIIANKNKQATGFNQLTEKLEEVAKKAQQIQQARSESHDPSQEHQIVLFNDWGCWRKKARDRYSQIAVDWGNEFMLSQVEKKPIEVSIGRNKYLVTHIGLVLLGSVSIGKWKLGESYLIFLDVEEGNATSPSPKEWVSTVREDCFPFMAYLGEVNAHFNRLMHLNQLHPTERMRRIEVMTDVERDAYCRSATRLTPLLDEDLPATIETLVQMNTVWAHKTMTPTPRTTKEGTPPSSDDPQLTNKHSYQADNLATKSPTVQVIEAAFERFAQGSYPILEDFRRIISDDEKERRIDHVRRQVAWTRLWGDFEELHHNTFRHGDTAYRKWSEKLPDVLRHLKKLIDDSPIEAWFHQSLDKDRLLTLSGPCLAGFLVAQVVANYSDRIDPEQLRLSGISDPRAMELLTFARRLVCVIRYSLGTIPADEDVLRALLWLLSEIGHTQYGVDRRLDFERHLCLAAMEQPALYGLKSFYRDHLNHVVQVCLTGWLILESEFKDGNDQDRKVSEAFLAPNQRNEELLGQWFIASLLHDVGYVIDIGMGWADLLEKFEDPKVMGDLTKRIHAMVDDWTKHVDNWNDWGYKIEDRPGEDHGVVSALHVQSAIASITDPGTANYDAALTAIAHHNHLNSKISFKEERLSVLLVLCDELQEWDRPWLDLEGAALALSTVVAFNPVHTPQWHKPLSKVTTNLRLVTTPGNTTKVMIKIDSPILDFSIKYSADIHRNHSLFNAWLGRSRSLQRITLGDTSECPLDFRYRMKSMVAPPSGLFDRDATEPELARLWRIVRDQRIWSIHRWLEAASNGIKPPPIGSGSAEQGVMYKLDDKGISETVILDVRQLGVASLISGDLKEFWQKVSRWPHAHESIDEAS